MDAIGRLVRNGTAIGTGFVVTEDGLVATATHVIGRHADATWTFEPLARPGLSLPVDTSEPGDPDTDVALLRLGDDAPWQPLDLAPHTGVTPGAPVHLRGYAQARGYDYDSGVGHYIGETSIKGRVWAKVSCRHAQHGMSGAPVLLTGTGCVIGVVSARLNSENWNRDSLHLAPVERLVELAPDRLSLIAPRRRFLGGTLRLAWLRGEEREPVLETDDFDVSLGRNATNRVYLPDPHDSRFHGHLSLVRTTLVYRHLGSHPAYLSGPERQLRLGKDESCVVGDKDRLQVASGTLLVEFSAPDLYDPNAQRTASADSTDTEAAIAGPNGGLRLGDANKHGEGPTLAG